VFRIALAEHRFDITAATTDQNEERAKQAVRDLFTDPPQQSPRILQALHYYRHALRLSAIEPSRESMAAEVILNLAKSIEVVFATSTLDVIRTRAKQWGLDPDFIERWIITILVIRNHLDVAHVAISPPTEEQIGSVLKVLSRAKVHVHTFLEQMIDRVDNGHITLNPIAAEMGKDKQNRLDRIAEYANS
jgi:hypothetical protein